MTTGAVDRAVEAAVIRIPERTQGMDPGTCGRDAGHWANCEHSYSDLTADCDHLTGDGHVQLSTKQQMLSGETSQI
jgi:hypothetical protein